MLGQRLTSTVVLGLVVAVVGCHEGLEQTSDPWEQLEGPYLGQPLPGTQPELFAPGLITGRVFTRDVAMTPDGNELFFGAILGRYAVTTICSTRMLDGHWTPPEVAPFATDPRVMNIEPALSPDGSRLMFLSNRPGPHGESNQDIWVVDRVADGWSEPYNLGPPVNSEAAEFFPSLTRNGTLYFTRTNADRDTAIYRSRLVAGVYTEPERLPSEVNGGRMHYNAFIAPDESFLILTITGREDCLGGEDYYVSFRTQDDDWSGPFTLGEPVNTAGPGEHSPYVSHDGQVLFFMSTRLPIREGAPPSDLTWKSLMTAAEETANGAAQIYWIDAGFIESLRPS